MDEIIISYAEAIKLAEDKYIKEKYLYTNNFGKILINNNIKVSKNGTSRTNKSINNGYRQI